MPNNTRVQKAHPRRALTRTLCKYFLLPSILQQKTDYNNLALFYTICELDRKSFDPEEFCALGLTDFKLLTRDLETSLHSSDLYSDFRLI